MNCDGWCFRDPGARFRYERIMRDQEQKPLSHADLDLDGMGHPEGRERSRNGRSHSTENLENPQAYQAFVDAMYAKIRPKLASRLDDDIQIEIAALTRLLATMPRKIVNANRVYFETAFDLLAADEANLIVIRSIRYDLMDMKEKSSGFLTRIVMRFCGDTPLHAVISGLFTVLVLSLVLLLVISSIHHLALKSAAFMEFDLPLFADIRNFPVDQVLLLAHAAFIGTVVSILVRIGHFLSIPAFSSLLIFVSVVTRPFLAAMFAILAFVLLKAGVVSFLGIDLDGPNGSYLVWALGFVCGFSERLAQSFVTRATGAFGGSVNSGPNRKP